MVNQQLLCRALYDFNLTQLSIIAALENMAALIEQVTDVSPQMSVSLRRRLEAVGNNCDRSYGAMYALINESSLAD